MSAGTLAATTFPDQHDTDDGAVKNTDDGDVQDGNIDDGDSEGGAQGS